MVDNLEEAGGFLFGRRTFVSLGGYWPNASEEEQAVAKPLNTKPKYVASTTLTEPLDRENSTLLEGDVAEAVAALKQEDGGDLHVIGSTQLAGTLLEHDLIDELRLMIDPGRARRRQAHLPRRRAAQSAAARRQQGYDDGRVSRHLRRARVAQDVTSDSDA